MTGEDRMIRVRVQTTMTSQMSDASRAIGTRRAEEVADAADRVRGGRVESTVDVLDQRLFDVSQSDDRAPDTHRRFVRRRAWE